MKINSLLCATVLSPKILACTLAPGSNPNALDEIQKDVNILLGILLLITAGTIFLFFKKGKKGVLAVIVSFLFFGFSILTSNAYVGDCGDNAIFFAQTSILITFICFMFQLITFIFFRKKPLAELP